MAINIDPSVLMEIQDLIKESEDPTARGREKRKMSVEDIKLYDWERMTNEQKESTASSLGLPVKELENRLKEKSVETRMEFNIEGDEKATSKLQKSAQAMIDAYGGNMSKSGFDRDIKLFEDAYGEKLTNILVDKLRPKTDSNVSAPEGSKSTTVGPGDVMPGIIPSEEELMSTDKDQLEQKLMNDPGVQAFINYLMPSSTTEERELKEFEVVEEDEDEDLPLKNKKRKIFNTISLDKADETKKSSSDPFAGSSTPVFMESESNAVEDMLREVPSGTVDPLEPVERIYSDVAEYTDETIGGGDHADPFSGTNVDVFTEPAELIEEDFTDEERKEAREKREEQELVDQFIEGNLPEPKKKGAGKQKVKNFFKKFKRKKKNKGNNQEFPEFTGDEMDKYYNNGGKLSGGQYKLDKNKDGKISGADFKMMKEGGRMNYMGGGMMKPFMAYLMGGKSPKYAMGGMTDEEPTAKKSGEGFKKYGKVTAEILARINELKKKPQTQLTNEEYDFLSKYKSL
jgi:hypothetical protein